jgi:hypothetical protein
MLRTSLARLGLTTAIAATALAGLLIAPGSAAAAVQNRCYLDGWMSSSPGTVDAWLYRQCINPESYVPLNLTMQRYDSVTDSWINIATGKGHVTYHCAGTAPNYFHMTALPNDYILANCS